MRVGMTVAFALAKPADGFDAGCDEAVSLARADRMRCRPQSLKRRGAVTMYRGTRNVTEAAQQADDAAQVVTGLPGRLRAANDDVLDLVRVQRRNALECCPHDGGAQIVGTCSRERTLLCTA